jgi:hypothetical protein
MRTKTKLTLTALIVSTLIIAVMAASVAPVLLSPFQPGDAYSEAAQINYGPYMYAYKIDPDANGVYVATFGDYSCTITISNDNGTHFDWTATSPIDAVIVKGGGGNLKIANVYYYNPAVSSDTQLTTPINQNNGKHYDISHMTFCWNPHITEYYYDTALAYGGSYANDFIANGFHRWGWSNGPLSEGNYQFAMWVGAGQSDLTKGTYVGTVDIAYLSGTLTVNFNLVGGCILNQTHVYAGSAMFPTLKTGEYTVAPGQYKIQSPLSGDIYVIVHAIIGIPVPP